MKIECDVEAKMIIKAQIDASLKLNGINAFGDALRTLIAIGELVYEPDKETKKRAPHNGDEGGGAGKKNTQDKNTDK